MEAEDMGKARRRNDKSVRSQQKTHATYLSNQIHVNLDNVLYSRKVTGFFFSVLFVNLVSAVQQGSYYGEITSHQRLSVLTTKPL